MKKITTSLLFLMFSLSYGQVTLEHTYNENVISRVYFPGVGEKYYLLNEEEQQLKFFNSDHTPWMNVPLSLPVGFQYLTINNVSSHLVNADDQIEVVYSYLDISYNEFSKIIAADGTIISSGNQYITAIDETDGLPAKMLIREGAEEKVYSFPGNSLEHSYQTQQLRRMIIENAGEKYFYFDNASSNLFLFNNDHTLWKTISCPKPDSYEYGNLFNIAATLVNGDTQYEAIYNYYLKDEFFHVLDYGVNISYENGQLIEFPDAYFFRISRLAGYATKLEIENVTPTEHTTTIYSLPGLTPLVTFPGLRGRIALELSGEKYVHVENGTLNLYNSDQSLWKTINLPVSPGFEVGGTSLISETFFNDDPQLEFGYESHKFTNIDVYEFRIIKEDGVVLQTIDDASELTLSHIEGLQDKIIATMVYSVPGVYRLYNSVFSVGAPLHVVIPETDSIAAYPNPASSFIRLKSTASRIINVSVCDLSGKNISNISNSDINKIDVNNYPNGLYLLRIIDANGNKSIKKFAVAH